MSWSRTNRTSCPKPPAGSRRLSRPMLASVNPLAPVPSSESWWDVPVSQVSDLDSTQAAYKTYEGHKARQRPYLTPSEGTDR